MNEPLYDSSTMGLALEERIPLAWTVLESLPEQVQLAKLQLLNQETLNLILGLEEYSLEWNEESYHLQGLGRLEFKINLLLSLVGQLLAQQIRLPEPVFVKLTPTELQWESKTAPELGSLLQIEIYLSLKYPRPITLLGHVYRIQSGSDSFNIAVSIEELSESLQQAVERLIFRYHRRLTAHSRRAVAHPGD